MIARAMLAVGPAIPTQNISFLGLLSFRKFTGTGFAQPNRKGDFVIIRSKGRIIVPMGSIWGIGFRVNLPECLAVESPNL